jgi:hypothetical protein
VSTAAIANRPNQVEPRLYSPARPDSAPRPGTREVRYRCSEQFLPILRHLNASLLVWTYQTGKVTVISPQASVHEGQEDQLSLSFIPHAGRHVGR